MVKYHNEVVPHSGERWRHKVSKVHFTVIFVSNTTVRNKKFKPTVVYQNWKGDVFTRELKVFLNKMEKLSDR